MPVAPHRHRFGTRVVMTLLVVAPWPRPAAAQATAIPTHSLERTATIPGAGDGGAYYLTGVVTVTASAGSTLVVHDRNPEPALLAFDADGRFLYRIGREGQGPGEYLMIHALGFLKDTLWVTDPRQRRVTWYRDGEPVRVETWGSPILVASSVAFLRDGTVITYESAGADRFRPRVRERDGATIAELPVLRTESTRVRREVAFRDGPLSMFNPFAAIASRCGVFRTG